MTYIDLIDSAVDLATIGDRASLEERISKMGVEKISTLVADLQEALPSPTKGDGLFRYAGNSSLSGFPYPCRGYSCRSRNLGEIANFAALYADEVVLLNPFNRLFVPRSQKLTKIATEEYVKDVAFHVAEILMVRPLIDRGIFSFENEVRQRYCKDCFQKALAMIVSGSLDETYNTSLYFKFLEYFCDHAGMYLENKVGRTAVFALSGEEELFGHASRYTYPLKQLPRHMQVGDSLTREEIVKLEAGDSFARHAANDFMQGTVVCEQYGVNNVVSSEQHMGIFRSYFGPEEFGDAKSVEYPLLGSGRLQSILEFRDQEWHHLHDFRKLVEEGLKSGSDVSEALDDSSAKIRGIVAKNARTINREIIKEGAVTVAGLGVTLASAGVSGMAAAVLGLLTTGHLVKELVPRLIDRFSEPEEVRGDRSYYAWKVRKRGLN